MSLNSFESILKSLSPAMATLLLRGSPECLDSYNRPRIITPGTAGIGLTWRRDKKGFYLGQEKSNTAGGGSISIVDSGAAPELRATSGTIFWTARNFQTNSSAYIISKSDGGGTHLFVYIGIANQIAIYDGTNIRTATSTKVSGAKTIAISWVSGEIPRLFVDGNYAADFSGTLVPTGNDADLYLTNRSAANSGSQHVDYGCFIIFNDALLGRAITDQEISWLNDAWDSIISIHRPKRTISIPKPIIEVIGSAPVIEIAGDGKNVNNIVPDRSGNGNSLTCSGGPLTQRSDRGRIIHSAYGKGGASGPLMQSPVNANLYPDSWTVVFRTPAIRTRGENNAGRVFTSDQAGTSRCYLLPSGVPVTWMTYLVSYVTTDAIWSFPISQGTSHIVVMRHDKSNPANLPAVTVDGEAVVVGVGTPGVGALNPAASARLSLFNYPSPAGAARAGDLDLSDFAIVPRYVSDSEARDLYLNHALSDVRQLANRTDYPVSVAAVGVGGRAGPWIVLTNSAKWDDDGTRRRFISVVNSTEGCLSGSGAYGAYYWRGIKAVAGSYYYVEFAVNHYKLAQASGYTLNIANAGSAMMYRMTNGGGPVGIPNMVFPVGTFLNGVDYEFFITRRPRDGMFSLWCRGGTWATWTLLGTGADTTHTSGLDAICALTYAGCYIADFMYWPDGSGLLPTDVMP